MKKQTVTERFLRYVSFATQSDEESASFPSTPGQAVLAQQLVSELRELGLPADFDEKSGCVYAHIEANCEGKPAVGFISHLDTSPEAPGDGVKPRFVEDYDGGDIILSAQQGVVLSPAVFPELLRYKGETLIVTDGTTLLGSDDKSGIAEIMTLAQELVLHPEISHGRICIAFTPDEEIGGGIDRFDLERFGADFAYTVDGGALGELEYECFNAASARVTVRGVNVHTGEAKGKMKNASRIAMEFDSLLPAGERPELTEGYEGFFHLESIRGSVESAELLYLIRDHDRQRFEEKKSLMTAIASELNQRFGADTVTVEISDTYRNMKEKICPDNMFLIDNAAKAMRRLGIEPLIQPIRGGTDGANLSWRGLPCPNLCAGGHNFHGKYEYVSTRSMELIAELLVGLVQLF